MRKFDFIPYLRSPRLSAVTGLIVSTRLLQGAQGQPLSDTVVEAFKTVRGEAEQLRAVMLARKQSSLSLRKPADRRFDAAWGGLFRRVETWTRLVDEPEAARAQQVITRLFPRGLAFLSERLEAEWVQSGQLLEQIAAEQLEETIIELAGERMWSLVLGAHAELGEVLGLEQTLPPPGPTVAEQVRALAQAIGNLGRIYAGTVSNDVELELFETVMRPLAELRARSSSSSLGAEDAELDAEADAFEDSELELEAPLPELQQPAQDASLV